MSCPYTYEAEIQFPAPAGDYDPLQRVARLMLTEKLLNQSSSIDDLDRTALAHTVAATVARAITDDAPSDFRDWDDDGEEERPGACGAWITPRDDGTLYLRIQTEPLWDYPKVFDLLEKAGCHGTILSEGDDGPGAQTLQPPTDLPALDQRLRTALDRHDTAALAAICDDIAAAAAPLLAHLLHTHLTTTTL
ncbi:hypothetical protein ACQP2U_43670 (plasmid) [Nocardia sp. CA-084685]|uniref:hypothetical protein n=1 Tax=Nocardia sp. CA-084685 TaxID=3239970 RepID=UPI003D996943